MCLASCTRGMLLIECAMCLASCTRGILHIRNNIKKHIMQPKDLYSVQCIVLVCLFCDVCIYDWVSFKFKMRVSDYLSLLHYGLIINEKEILLHLSLFITCSFRDWNVISLCFYPNHSIKNKMKYLHIIIWLSTYVWNEAKYVYFEITTNCMVC